MDTSKNAILKIFAALLLCAGLSACTACPMKKGAPLTPLPGGVQDPDDKVAAIAVRHFLEETGAPVSSAYDLARHDLNGDGMREALVMMKTPYGYWCGTHGCTVLVFRAYPDHFTLVNAIQPVREPVFISPVKTNGWNNLVMRVSGRWTESKDVALQFDGRKYPENPDSLPPYLSLSSGQDVRIFYHYF